MGMFAKGRHAVWLIPSLLEVRDWKLIVATGMSGSGIVPNEAQGHRGPSRLVERRWRGGPLLLMPEIGFLGSSMHGR